MVLGAGTARYIVIYPFTVLVERLLHGTWCGHCPLHRNLSLYSSCRATPTWYLVGALPATSQSIPLQFLSSDSYMVLGAGTARYIAIYPFTVLVERLLHGTWCGHCPLHRNLSLYSSCRATPTWYLVRALPATS